MAKRTRRKARFNTADNARKRAAEHKSGFSNTCYEVPSGTEFFKLEKEGIRRVAIIPYIVGARNPYFPEGTPHYEQTFYIHKNIGVEEQRYLCLKKTVGKKCPVCAYAAQLRTDPDYDKDFVKSLSPKERQLWNVVDLDERGKGVQLWDISYSWFGETLDQKIKFLDEDEADHAGFAQDIGWSALKLTVVESNFHGHYEVGAIDFKPQKNPMPEEWLDGALVLDDLLTGKR